MERRISLYVSKKNVITWLAAIFILASAVVRIVLECTLATPSANPWGQVVLPIAATVLYLLVALVWGKEMFYKTAIAVWLIALYYIFRIHTYGFGTMIEVLFWIALVFFAELGGQFLDLVLNLLFGQKDFPDIVMHIYSPLFSIISKAPYTIFCVLSLSNSER